MRDFRNIPGYRFAHPGYAVRAVSGTCHNIAVALA